EAHRRPYDATMLAPVRSAVRLRRARGIRRDQWAVPRELRKPIGGPAAGDSRHQPPIMLPQLRQQASHTSRQPVSTAANLAAWSSARIASMISSNASPLITFSIL